VTEIIIRTVIRDSFHPTDRTIAGEQHVAEIFERLSCGALRTGVTLRINNYPVAGDSRSKLGRRWKLNDPQTALKKRRDWKDE
jgi:hypothetical protein